MRNRYQFLSRGSVLLMVLVMMGVFMVMLMAGAQLVSSQSRLTVIQAQQEQSFQLAEAGVHYADWAMNFGGQTPAQLVASPPPPQTITDPTTNRATGTFTLTFTSQTNAGITTVTATSVGQDASLASRKQTIVATFSSTNGTVYILSSWDHQL